MEMNSRGQCTSSVVEGFKDELIDQLAISNDQFKPCQSLCCKLAWPANMKAVSVLHE